MPAEAHLLAPFSDIVVDKGTPAPVYVQIATALSTLLRSGAIPAGTLLPPERLLCAQFDVSRMTVRQAMGVLDREGLIESHRGKGTFVRPRRLQKQEQEFRSFSEEIRQRGGIPESKLISFNVVEPGKAAREFFDLHRSEKVYELCRLRLNDGEPLAAERAQIPQRLVPGLERHDFSKNSLYKTLEGRYGLVLEKSLEEISAELPNGRDRRLLKMPPKAAVLVVNRRTFSNAGAPLELTESRYRGDMYTAVVHSVRKQKG
jgi:GntR family transcriptional regulator, N-acetylglucosamine utilization regulator